MKIFNLLTKYVHSVCIFFIALISLVSFEAVAKDFKEFEPGHTTKEGGNKTVVAKNVANLPHPLKSFADRTVECPNNGLDLAKFFLCGDNDERKVTIDGNSIIWDKLNENDCEPEREPTCPNTNLNCTWTQIGLGKNFTIKDEGQYRLSIDGGIHYYFNVYKDHLNFKVKGTNITCNKPGQIEAVLENSKNFKYSLDNKEGPYNDVSSFEVGAGKHFIYIKRKIGENEGDHSCIFSGSADIKDESGIKIDIKSPEALCGNQSSNPTITIKITGGNSPDLRYKVERKYPGGDFSTWRGDGSAQWDKEFDIDIEFKKKAQYKVIAYIGGECSKEETIDIDFPDPLKMTVTTLPISCVDGKLIVNVKGGTAPYYYILNNETENQKKPLLDSGIPIKDEGNYDVYVIDNKGCKVNEKSINVKKIVPNYKIRAFNRNCSGVNGSIEVEDIDPKVYKLSYSIEGKNFQQSPRFENLEKESYTVTVRYVFFYGTVEVLRCEEEQVVVVGKDPAITDFSDVITENISCNPKKGTKVKIYNVVGGTPPYTYSIDAFDRFTAENEGYITAGTKSATLVVKDNKGCKYTKQIVIPDPPAVPVLLVEKEYVCDGTATVMIVLDKNKDYEYKEYKLLNVDNSKPVIVQNTNVFKNIPDGSYLPWVKYRVLVPGADPSTKFCDYELLLEDKIFTVNNPPPFKASTLSIINISCFGGNNGEVAIGVTPLNEVEYSLDNGSSWEKITTDNQKMFEVKNLSKGEHVIWVRNPANTECITKLDPINITEPDKLTLSVKETKIIGCDKVSVSLESTGGTGNKTYTLKLPDNTQLEHYNNPFFEDVKALSGSYLATVTDAKGCKSEISFEVNLPPPLTVTTEGSDLCYTSEKNAAIVLNIGGGTAPYQYSKDNGDKWTSLNLSSPVKVENLTPGAYSFIVRDKWGCEKKLDPIVVGKQLKVSASLKKSLDCTPSPDAVITLKVEGGVTPIRYQVYKDDVAQGSTVELTETTKDYTVKDAGEYSFEIKDANGCSLNVSKHVDPLIPITFDAESGPKILCHGSETGEIIIKNLAGGSVPFSYKIEVLNTDTNKSYGDHINGLPAGHYKVTITDTISSCSTLPKEVLIEQNDAVTFEYGKEDYTCGGFADPNDKTIKGTITIKNVKGGEAPYTYILKKENSETKEQNDNGSDYPFKILEFGIYSVQVIDKNSCAAVRIDNIKIASPPGELEVEIFDAGPDCNIPGKAKVKANGELLGDGPFFFAVYKGKEPVYPDDFKPADNPATDKYSATFNNLIPGVTYNFVVFDDGTKCRKYKTDVKIPTLSTLVSKVYPKNVCKGAEDGKVSFTFDKYQPTTTEVSYEIHYALSNEATGVNGNKTIPGGVAEQSVDNLGPLKPGKYYILFKELSSGCTKVSEEFDIKESPTILTISAKVVNNANCHKKGRITITSGGGAGKNNYLVKKVTGPAVDPPAAEDSGWITSSQFDLDEGIYKAYVKDDYGCIKEYTDPLEIKKDPLPEITAVVADPCAQGQYSIEVNRKAVTDGVGPYLYSLDGEEFKPESDKFTYKNLNSGAHKITIKDGNGCTFETTVTIYEPLALDNSDIKQPSCEDNDGSITLKYSGGSGTIQYELKHKDGNTAQGPQPEGKFEGLASGDYIVSVSDTGIGCHKDYPFTLEKATPVTFSTETTAVSCFGDSDGTITVTLGSGNNNSPYKFSLNGGTPQIENIFKGLAAGTYKVTVVSERGCKKEEENVVIGGPVAALAINGDKISVQQFGCTPANVMVSAVITVDPAVVISGGNAGGHRLELKNTSGNIIDTSDNINPATAPVHWNISDTKGGTYILTVIDSKGCKDLKNIVVEPYDELKSASAEVTEMISCVKGESVEIKVVTSGSAPGPANPADFEYSKNGGTNWQPSNKFSDLPVGGHAFMVRHKLTRCVISTAISVENPNDINIENVKISSVICFSEETGEITFSASSATYTGTDFNWEIYKEGVTAAEKTGIYKKGDPDTKVKRKAGTYKLVVKEKDLPGCSTEYPFEITEPQTPLTLVPEEISNVSCDKNRGAISAKAQGGWGDYQYKLEGPVAVDFSTKAEFYGLKPGVYTVTVKDSKGCETPGVPIELKEPDPITATITTDKTDNKLSCYGNKDATITLTAAGGSGKYLYELYQDGIGLGKKQPTNNKFTNLGAGSYYVVITDDWDCSKQTNEVKITEPDAVTAYISESHVATCKTSEQIEFKVSGGTPPYRYRKVGEVAFKPLPTGPIDIAEAEYKDKYQIIDTNDCAGPQELGAEIHPKEKLKIDIELDHASVGCDRNSPEGKLLAIASGGSGQPGEYKYQLIKNGQPEGQPQDTGVFDKLADRTYKVKVTGGDCEAESEEIVITDYESLKVTYDQKNLDCYGNGPVGKVIIKAQGGSGAYLYTISPSGSEFGSNNTFDKLKSGKYTITVKDKDIKYNCFVSNEITITEPEQIKATHTTISESCKGKADGSIKLMVSGGEGPYSTRIQGEPSAVEGRLDLVNLKGGDYRIQILDKNGCNIVYNVHLPLTPSFDPIATITYTCDENNKNSNQVVVSVNPEMKDKVNSYLLYQLSGGAETKVEEQNSNLFSDLSPGTYIVRLSDGNNCNEQTASFEIVAVSPLELKLDMKELNVIVATVSGGVTPYHYYFNDHDNGNRSDYRIKESKTYTVRVVDKAGCKIEENIYGEFIDVHIPNFFTPNDDGHNDTWGPENIQNYPKIKTRIFDRYGREIKTLEPGQTWDGKLNGVSLPSGDYWYIIKLNGEEDTREFVGNITIYR